MPLPVAPARSSLASERRKPSTPWRVAATSGESSAVTAREIVTTRPEGASFLSADGSESTAAEASAGRAVSVSSSTMAPRRSPSARPVASRSTGTPQPCTAEATASAWAVEAASDTTRTGPTVSGAPGLWRRSMAGRGRPSFLATVLVRPVLTALVYASVIFRFSLGLQGRLRRTR